MPTRLLSGREAAKELKVSHQTVYNWIKTGKLQPTSESSAGPLFDPDYIRLFASLLDRDRQTTSVA